MKKYLALLKTYLGTIFTYRANIIGTILLELISIGNIFILWAAVFRTHEEVHGITFQDTIAYYILVPLVGTITNVTISDFRSKEIRTGELSRHLIKPYHLWTASFVEAVAQKVVVILLVLPIYSAILISIEHSTDHSLFELSQIIETAIILIAAFMLHFFIDLAISWLAFWVSDIWSFSHFKIILFSVLGGLSFPFTLLSDPVRNILEKLPFQYFYYVPIQYITNKEPCSHLTDDVKSILLWVILFTFIAFLLWKQGLKKYAAYGN